MSNHSIKKTFVAVAIGQLISVSGSEATIFNVTNITPCTIAEAITASNTNTSTTNCDAGSANERDIINLQGFNAISTRAISGNLFPFVTSDITINGADGTLVSRSGDSQARILAVTGTGDLLVNNVEFRYGSFSSNYQGAGFYVGENASLELNDVTLFRMHNDGGGDGGAIYSKGNLALNNVDITESRAVNGGGISITGGTANVNGSIIDNNSSFGTPSTNTSVGKGAGIFAENAMVTLSDSTVSENTATHRGAGIFSSETTVSITDSTISANTTSYHHGAGIHANDSTHALNNTTISGNRTISGLASGAGMYAGYNSDVTLTNTTIIDNQASANQAGALYVLESAVRLDNSILANSIDANECAIGLSSSLNTGKHSIIEDGSCGTTALAVDPTVTSLGDYGGTTLTHNLLPGSPAIDAANIDRCPQTDQRGIDRGSSFMTPIVTSNGNLALVDLSDRCDIGAVEYLPID